jgi:hypothetical protein
LILQAIKIHRKILNKSNMLRFALLINHCHKASKEWGWKRDETREKKTNSEAFDCNPVKP